jgi:hypothetical protein
MSIYVLRSDNLVKIGFSDDLRHRVTAIISMVPVPVEFVGHMPGDREIEAHLHNRFQAHRFSGEWFVETKEMRLVFEVILTASLPDLPERERRDRLEQREAQKSLSSAVQKAAKSLWPHKSAGQRVSALADNLGWKVSRAKDFYYGHERMALRGVEQKQIEKWLFSRRVAAPAADTAESAE